MLNLFIGIIVDAMQSAQHEERQEDKSELKDFTHLENERLHQQLGQLQQDIEVIKTQLDAKNESSILVDTAPLLVLYPAMEQFDLSV